MSARGIEDFDTYEYDEADVFGDFIKRCLIPILQPFNGSNARSVVVMDNAAIHRVNDVVTSIQTLVPSSDFYHRTAPTIIHWKKLLPR